ncbi:MAG: hypothetical protein RLZZ598_170 [Pseudomonadota bacterium]|jgi:hypothetical protein
MSQKRRTPFEIKVDALFRRLGATPSTSSPASA